MSREPQKPGDAHDLFSVAGMSEHSLHGSGDLEPARPAAKPVRTRKREQSPSVAVEYPNERYLRDLMVARRYGVSRQSVWRWAAQGRLPKPIKLSEGATRWRESDLLAHEAALEKRPKAKQARSRLAPAGKAGDQR
ncbi:helix-turn-helix transcriptional regulator [Roseivivax sp. CAU 1761]